MNTENTLFVDAHRSFYVRSAWHLFDVIQREVSRSILRVMIQDPSISFAKAEEIVMKHARDTIMRTHAHDLNESQATAIAALDSLSITRYRQACKVRAHVSTIN